MGDREGIGGHIAVGHLTSPSRLHDGDTFHDGSPHLHADAEVAVEIGTDRYGAALELVDLAPLDGEPDSVVAANVFHRAVAFSALRTGLPFVEARLIVNGEVRAAAPAPTDLSRRLADAEALLAAVGEGFEPGDLVITGSVVQVPVAPGDEVTADLGELGAVTLRVSSAPD